VSDLTFLDLVVMQRIDENSTVEKFGTLINTSFFEAANLLGTLKVKGYVDIQPSIGGNSKITLTEAGASILQNAVGKIDEPVDALDNAIMKTLASGIRDLDKLNEALNIRSSDLAYHLNKLEKQQFLQFDIRSAKVNIALTEKGFNLTGGFRAVEQKAPPSEAEKEAHEIMKPGVLPAQAGTALPKAPEPKAPPWVNIGAFLKPAESKTVQAPAEGAPTVAPAQTAAAQAAAVQTTLQQKPATKSDMAMSKYSYYMQKYAIIVVLGVLLGLVAGWYFFLQGKI